MKILFTGSKGFIGKNVLKTLENDYEIYEISRDRKYCTNNKKRFYFDLNSKKLPKNLIEKIKKINIDCIIHLAFKVNKIKKSNSIDLFQSNLAISLNMIEITKLIQPKIFINFSSVSVYPSSNYLNNELCYTDPSNNNDFYYGLSKLNSEFLYNYTLKDIKLRLIHLRVAQVLDSKMPKNRIYAKFISQIKKNNKIIVYGDGKRKIPIVYLKDLIMYLKKIMISNFSGIINVGSENISMQNLAKKVIEEYGNQKTKIIYEENKFIKKNNMLINFSLLNKKFKSVEK